MGRERNGRFVLWGARVKPRLICPLITSAMRCEMSLDKGHLCDSCDDWVLTTVSCASSSEINYTEFCDIPKGRQELLLTGLAGCVTWVGCVGACDDRGKVRRNLGDG
ncbi:hypothetical protein Zmor_009269 [Zophobas morio]|uniref:Uncharacterized protein n=1 Tax=Zophobas morio TaxID=2755281 RepID=A0AA38IM89_9CUCU|nr:hypothetical protein Zmor_009269 [Zophobas morio]